MAASARLLRLLETLVATIAVALSLFMHGACYESIIEGTVDGISRPLIVAQLEFCMLTSGLDYTNGASIAQADSCKRWVIQGLAKGDSIKDAGARGVECAQKNGLDCKFAQCLDRAIQCPSLVESIVAQPINILTHLPQNLANLAIKSSNGLLSAPLSMFNLQKCMVVSNLNYSDISAVLQADTCKACVMQGLLTGISAEDSYRKGAECAQRNDLPESFQCCLRSACLENSLIQNIHFFGFNMPQLS